MDQKNEQLLSTVEAAAQLKVSLSFLAKARAQGTGPNFIKIGRKVVYRRSALDAYLCAHTSFHKQL